MMGKFCNTIVLTFLLAASGNAITNAPGGVEGCSYWGTPTDTVMYVPSGISFYCVQKPERGAEAVYWTADTKKGRIVMTDNRLADLRSLSYINFEKTALKRAQISSYYNKKLETDSITFGFNRRTDGIPVRQNGKNAEIAVYNRVLRPSERMRVETYLAVRHDVTLKNNYIASNKEVVWDTQDLGDFSDCITGIAKDDRSTLHKDTALNSVLTLVCKSELIDGQYLMVGSTKDKARFTVEGNDSCVCGKKWAVQASGADCVVDAVINSGEFNQIVSGTDLKTLLLEVDGVRYPVDESGTAKSVLFRKGTNRLRLLSTDGKLAHKANAASVFDKLVVYPNPTTDGHVKIQMELAEPMAVDVCLYDMNGRLMNRQNTGVDDYHDVTVSLPYKGIYNIQLNTFKESKTIQLIRK